MSMEHAIRLIAGTFILANFALGRWVSPWFFLFPAFVGANLLQSSLTKWCLMEDILAKFGLKRCGERPKQEPMDAVSMVSAGFRKGL